MHTRFHQYSNQGLSAIDIEVVGSAVHVRRGPALDRLGEPEVTSFGSPAEATAHAQAVAQELRKAGAAPAFEQDPELARFYAEEFESLLAEQFEVDLEGGGQPGLVRDMEEHCGVVVPPELRVHLRL